MISRTLRFRIALSAALRRLAAWADPYPGYYVKAPAAQVPLVAYDGDGNRVLVRVDPERIQYVITASQPTRDDFERDAASRRAEVFGV